MVRRPCCAKEGVKKGGWTSKEDDILASYVKSNGEGRWMDIPQKAGLRRCGKSCRLRWLNYLRPTIKRGNFLPEEDELIVRLHRLLGNRWSLIAARLPGRTDNEIKNYWNNSLGRKVLPVAAVTRMNITTPDASTATPLELGEAPSSATTVWAPKAAPCTGGLFFSQQIRPPSQELTEVRTAGSETGDNHCGGSGGSSVMSEPCDWMDDLRALESYLESDLDWVNSLHMTE